MDNENHREDQDNEEGSTNRPDGRRSNLKGRLSRSQARARTVTPTNEADVPRMVAEENSSSPPEGHATQESVVRIRREKNGRSRTRQDFDRRKSELGERLQHPAYRPSENEKETNKCCCGCQKVKSFFKKVFSWITGKNEEESCPCGNGNEDNLRRPQERRRNFSSDGRRGERRPFQRGRHNRKHP